MRLAFLTGICFYFLILLGCSVGSSVSPVHYPYEKNNAGLSERQNAVIDKALSLLGSPYRFGGTTPKGFDCSGFVRYVFKNALRRPLPRLARHQIKQGRFVPPGHLRPADIIYFKIKRGNSPHVGIYLGNGKFIHAPSSGGRVNVQSLNTRYWKNRFIGGRRVI